MTLQEPLHLLIDEHLHLLGTGDLEHLHDETLQQIDRAMPMPALAAALERDRNITSLPAT